MCDGVDHNKYKLMYSAAIHSNCSDCDCKPSAVAFVCCSPRFHNGLARPLLIRAGSDPDRANNFNRISCRSAREPTPIHSANIDEHGSHVSISSCRVKMTGMAFG
jgi:hypothetical protein